MFEIDARPLVVRGNQPKANAMNGASSAKMPDEVSRLVDRFGKHRETYKSSNYNEAQARAEFIDPFFQSLGWDIANAIGHAEAYKDVVHEDSIKVGGKAKAPDYSFRIGGTRKFFLEAKRPSVNLKEDKNSAYQLRRYAWSAKLPLSVLTDFEEFAIYDGRIKPTEVDSAGTARIFYTTFDKYEDKWAFISSIFSKNSILDGSFDTFAASNRKKGTVEVDADFLAEIEKWRESLARSLVAKNRSLNGVREINYAVQATIDRLIFLRMCEDRGIEPYGQLANLAKGSGVYSRLVDLFVQSDDRYNSGIFHFTEEKGRGGDPDGLTATLKLEDVVLKSIIADLYYPHSPYEFSVIPADILGSVYEQFLGKVICVSTHREVSVVEKPEVRKAGGVYYTPTYVVDYIVRQTVGMLLEGKSPKQADMIRVLDPACGSGSFLLNAYECLLNWYRDQYVADAGDKRPEIYQGSAGTWHLTTSEKRRILLNCIYGVDIDPQAVEVTKLSLLLKVLEGESAETLEIQRRIFQERALPDLEYNIQCGNSLIGPDYYDQPRLTHLDIEEHHRVNVFDWNSRFPWLEEVGGFDAVISNPPYGAYFYDQDKAYLKEHYPVQTYQLDSYLLFLERSLRDLIRQGGFYGAIIPNPWLTNLLQTSVRKFVLDGYQVQSIVHFEFPIFSR